MKGILYRYSLAGAVFGAAAVVLASRSQNSRALGVAAAVLVLLIAWLAATLGYRRICRRLSGGESGFVELQPLRERLAEQERDLVAIQENMKEGLILMDRAGKIISMNRAAASLLQAEPGDYIGQTIFSVQTHPTVKLAVERALKGSWQEEQVALGDVLVSLYADPVRAEGQIEGVVLLLFEMTEKLAAEQICREFTANVSHELKTPLTAITGYAELLKEGLVPAEDVSDVGDAIWSESARLLALIEDILDLSRLDEAESLKDVEEVDLLELAGEVFNRLVLAAEKYGVTLTVSGEEAVITGNQRMLDELITNLAENALKYNHSGGHADIAVHNSPRGVGLTVKDDGIGIAREHHERVFERFYRVDKSRSKSTGGTGLGLSIVQHVAALHGARVKLTSHPGQGTQVSVFFPRTSAQSSEADL